MYWLVWNTSFNKPWNLQQKNWVGPPEIFIDSPTSYATLPWRRYVGYSWEVRRLTLKEERIWERISTLNSSVAGKNKIITNYSPFVNNLLLFLFWNSRNRGHENCHEWYFHAWSTACHRQPIAVSYISIYICLIDISFRTKSKEQLNERRAGLSSLS